jgi:lysophospholipase L1-like esterase
MKSNVKIYLYLAVIVILSITVYLNRMYSFIYQQIDNVHEAAPEHDLITDIGDEFKSNGVIKLAIIGDSLSVGMGVDSYVNSWPVLLAGDISQSAEKSVALYNFGIPGAKTADVLDNQLSYAVSASPDIVVVFIGVNDVHGNVGKAEFTQNYTQILNTLKTKTSAQIKVINIPALGSSDLIKWPFQTYFDGCARRLNSVIENLTKINDVQYLDLYAPTKQLLSKPGPHYSADNFHPSAAGYLWWEQIIYGSINY